MQSSKQTICYIARLLFVSKVTQITCRADSAVRVYCVGLHNKVTICSLFAIHRRVMWTSYKGQSQLLTASFLIMCYMSLFRCCKPSNNNSRSQLFRDLKKLKIFKKVEKVEKDK